MAKSFPDWFLEHTPTIKEIADMTPDLPMESNRPTLYKIHCPQHGAIYLTSFAMEKQSERAIRGKPEKYTCPRCGEESTFDDKYFELAFSYVTQMQNLPEH